MSRGEQSSGRVLTTAEAAEYLGVSARTLRRYIAMGLLSPGRLPGGHYRVSKESLTDLFGRTSLGSGGSRPSRTPAQSTRRGRGSRIGDHASSQGYDLSPESLAALRARHPWPQWSPSTARRHTMA